MPYRTTLAEFTVNASFSLATTVQPLPLPLGTTLVAGAGSAAVAGAVAVVGGVATVTGDGAVALPAAFPALVLPPPQAVNKTATEQKSKGIDFDCLSCFIRESEAADSMPH
jgi:hypothetical protein